MEKNTLPYDSYTENILLMTFQLSENYLNRYIIFNQ